MLINSRWHNCYPFEVVPQSEKYRAVSSSIAGLQAMKTANIGVFCDESGKSKTFEYNLAYANAWSPLLLTTSFSAGDTKVLTELSEKSPTSTFEELLNIDGLDQTLCHSLRNSPWDEREKKRALFAAHYLVTVKAQKGLNSLELQDNLLNDLAQASRSFVIPDYIADAVKWVA
jgi:putative ATP-dependent endonuclease of OLD family